MISTMMFITKDGYGRYHDIYNVLKLIMMYNKIKRREGIAPNHLLSCISTAIIKYNASFCNGRFENKKVILVQYGIDDDIDDDVERRCYYSSLVEWFAEKNVIVRNYDEICDTELSYSYELGFKYDKIKAVNDMINDIEDYIHKDTITYTDEDDD